MAEVTPVLRRFNLLAESIKCNNLSSFRGAFAQECLSEMLFRSEDEITDGGFRSAPVRRSGEQRGIEAHPCNVSQK